MTVYVDEYLIKKRKRKEKKNKDNQERQRTYCKYKNGKIGGKYSRIVDIKWTPGITCGLGMPYCTKNEASVRVK